MKESRRKGFRYMTMSNEDIRNKDERSKQDMCKLIDKIGQKELQHNGL